MSESIDRRTFLGSVAAGSAAIFVSGLAPGLGQKAIAGGGGPWPAASIPDLQVAMNSGELTSRELTIAYLDRIRSLNPILNSVIQTNPTAVSIAARLDNERRKGLVRGPMHGIPVLLKDNIATNDTMQTTAGSCALLRSKVPSDAVLVSRLREAGAVILGKANLGEWANFRGFNPLGFYGWSARGGATRNPHLLSYTAFGSSSGSAVSAAAGMCSVAVGTETDGSIIGPSNANATVGLKPTLGLISQNGIIPIGHSQDTAGPMGRSVTDVAILLGAIQSPFGPVDGQQVPADYTQFLERGTLAGKRIGLDRRFFDHPEIYGYPGDDDVLPLVAQAVDTIESLGATLVDTDTGDPFSYFNEEFLALLFEFKVQIAEYLGGLSHTKMRTLADLIQFNLDNCTKELVYYGQELFEISESTSGDLNDPVYVAARTFSQQSARDGIDSAIAKDDLDAVICPHLMNSHAPAVSGYPNLALPVGYTPEGKPAGMLMYSTFLREPDLLAFGYDLEQELQVPTEPQFVGSPVDPPNAGLCDPFKGVRKIEDIRGMRPRFVGW